MDTKELTKIFTPIYSKVVSQRKNELTGIFFIPKKDSNVFVIVTSFWVLIKEYLSLIHI